MNKRHAKMIEIVSQYGKIEVNELAEILKISKVTVRKDLEYLSEKGILKRERGFALLRSRDDINYRMAFHYEAKQRIAKAAAELVGDGETIIVESGSACALFAEEVLLMKRGITIITNSAYIANYVNDKPGTEIILLGGNYQKHTQAVIGPMTKQCIQNFRVDKIFVGTDGFSPELGFTGLDLIRADTVKSMAEQANHIYVLTESSKFAQTGTTSFLKTEEVYQLITDEGITQEKAELIKAKGVIVKIV